MASSTSAAVPTGNTYDKYATKNPIEQRMMRGFLSTLDRFLDAQPATRILEVGIGEGEVSRHVRARFPDVAIVGIDLPDEELAGGWRADGLAAAFADATTLPFADKMFDLVLAVEVFEHFDDPRSALREVARVCSGTLVASVPMEPLWRVGNVARGRYVRALGNTPGHINHWGRSGFRRFVAQEFTVHEVATPLPWTMVRAQTSS